MSGAALADIRAYVEGPWLRLYSVRFAGAPAKRLWAGNVLIVTGREAFLSKTRSPSDNQGALTPQVILLLWCRLLLDRPFSFDTSAERREGASILVF